ncbi:unnamed protein product, partial [Durusdinium trenchii]
LFELYNHDRHEKLSVAPDGRAAPPDSSGWRSCEGLAGRSPPGHGTRCSTHRDDEKRKAPVL